MSAHASGTLGTFSVSLSVKDLAASREFYTALGFTVIDGNVDEGWQIVASGAAVIGLFQGHFEPDTLTFYSGWRAYASPMESFEGVDALAERLQAQGITIDERSNPGGVPTNALVKDPDGNPVLFVQYPPNES